MSLLTEVRSLISRHARQNGLTAPLAGVSLVHADTPTSPSHSLCKPTFALVVQGAKRTTLGTQIFDYAAGDYLVASVELPISGYVSRATSHEPYLAMTMALEPSSIAALLVDAKIDPRGADAAAIAINRAPDNLLDAVTRLLRLLDHPEDIAVMAPMLEREVLWRLLGGEQGSTVRQIGLADSHLTQISRAIAWIRDHYAEPLHSEILGHASGMSASTLYRHFRAITGMSPLQFQKHIRLQAARARMLANATQVATIGFAVGYESASQFSREYSRLFGMPPGKDAVRMRAAGDADRAVF